MIFSRSASLTFKCSANTIFWPLFNPVTQEQKGDRDYISCNFTGWWRFTDLVLSCPCDQQVTKLYFPKIQLLDQIFPCVSPISIRQSILIKLKVNVEISYYWAVVWFKMFYHCYYHFIQLCSGKTMNFEQSYSKLFEFVVSGRCSMIFCRDSYAKHKTYKLHLTHSDSSIVNRCFYLATININVLHQVLSLFKHYIFLYYLMKC